MLKLDVKRFQPGYKKPQPPAFADAEALNQANRIIDRLELAAKRFEKFGEGTAFGDVVQISLQDHEANNGYKINGQLFANSTNGELATLKAEIFKEGEISSHITYQKDETGKETYIDSLFGKVVKSREGAVLYGVDGGGEIGLY